MEVAHAVLHWALVGAGFAVAALEQGAAARVHALANFVVFQAGFHVGGALRLHEFTLESGDFLGVEKLHHVQRLVHAHRKDGGNGEHMRIPLHHDVRVVRQPDGAAPWLLPALVVQQHLMPEPVNVSARLEAGRHAHGLHRIVAAKLPCQIVTGHEIAQAGVEGRHVVVLQINLDEGLPVVVAFVQLHVVEHKAVKRKLRGHGHVRQVGPHVAAVVFKQQAVPLAQAVVVQAQARVLRKVRRTQQLAAGAVSPAVYGADDVAPRVRLPLLAQIAPALEHDGLAVAAHVGNQLQAAMRVAHQRAAALFLRQREVVARARHGQRMAHIARPGVEKPVFLARKQRLVKVERDGQLACRLLQWKT